MTGSVSQDPPSFHAGQRYRALRDLHIYALTTWRAPFTGGHEVVLPAGEVFKIAVDPPPGASAAVCDPERYEELHPVLIPSEDRNAPNYSGYYLSIEFDVIRKHAELLATG